MRCRKCKDSNITQANYCKKCGNKYTTQEQTKARKKTFVGHLEEFEKIYNILNLDFITGHILFKIATLIVILSIGIFIWINDGINVKLLNSNEYTIQYNKKEHEYYLISNKEKVGLNLYVPNRTENIEIKHYNKNNKIVEKKKYKKISNIILEAHTSDYYVLKVNYIENKTEKIKIYVYNEEIKNNQNMLLREINLKDGNNKNVLE